MDIFSYESIVSSLNIFFFIINSVIGYRVLREAIKQREVTTYPDIIYYLEVKDGVVKAIIENIGKSEAYDVHLNFYFFNGKPKFLPSTELRFEYIAPGQQYSYFFRSCLYIYKY